MRRNAREIMQTRPLGLRPKHGIPMSLNELSEWIVDYYGAELSNAQQEGAQNMKWLL